jgi:hypothetical protein
MQLALGLFTTLLPVVILVLIIRKFSHRDTSGVSTGTEIRQFFQYILQFALLVVTLVGLSGLLSRLFTFGDVIAGSSADLARNVTFIIIGGSLTVALASWSRRNLRNDPQEVNSFGWGIYVTLASITSLIITMIALHEIFLWAVGEKDFSAQAVSRFMVWAPAWYFHYWLDRSAKFAQGSQAHHLLGSLITLGTSAIGLARVIGGTIDFFMGRIEKDVIIQSVNPIYSALAILMAGAPFWIFYWIAQSSKARKEPLWFAYVLLGGVGLGLASTIIALSTVLYNTLVWIFGDPDTNDAVSHFDSLPLAIGFTIVGLLSWWYHRQVLESHPVEIHPVEDQQRESRTEVRRIYEYLIAGGGLFAAVGGLTTILVALIKTITQSKILVGGGTSNTLLMALTLLGVGGSLWWFFWNRIQERVRTFPQAEHASPTRRIYLFLLFGVVGVAAVIVLLISVYTFTRDLFEGNLSKQTLADMQIPLSLLISLVAIASYHWAIYRGERASHDITASGPSYVLFVGQQDPAFAREISQSTGARVQIWQSTDPSIQPWNTQEVLTLLKPYTGHEIIVLAEPHALKVIPIQRK